MQQTDFTINPYVILGQTATKIKITNINYSIGNDTMSIGYVFLDENRNPIVNGVYHINSCSILGIIDPSSIRSTLVNSLGVTLA